MKVLSSILFFLVCTHLVGLDNVRPKNDGLPEIRPELLKPPKPTEEVIPPGTTAKDGPIKKETNTTKNPDPVNGGPKGGLTSGDKDKPDPVNGGPKGGVVSDDKSKPDIQNNKKGEEVNDVRKKASYSLAMDKLLIEKKIDNLLCENIHQLKDTDYPLLSAEELLTLFHVLSTCAANHLIDTKHVRFQAAVKYMQIEFEKRFNNPELYEGEDSPSCRGIDGGIIKQVTEFIGKILPVNLGY